MTNWAIELRNVSKRFPNPSGGEVIAVNHVSLQINDGEFFSLLGPSGCGKTTSLRMIAGFEMPSAGEILIHGKSVGHIPPFKRPVNTVFQHYALFPHMTVGQNVGFGLEMKGIAKAEIKQRVGEALEMVRLAGMESRKPKQLSGGQQQRVSVARALINRPEVLLLDEPLGALDLKLRKEMQLELKTLQREVGITFIYVTHDQEEALTMSDRIAVMNLGNVLQIGTPSEIYEHPEDKFVADFIGESNFLEAVVSELGQGTVEVDLGNGLKFQIMSKHSLTRGQKVTVAIRPEKLSIRAVGAAMAVESGSNQFSGRVDEIVYIGTDTHYDLHLPDGQRIRVREQNHSPSSRLLANVGDEVLVNFSQEAAQALVD